MQRFKSILCVVDALESRHGALQCAVELADRNSAQLKLVDVLEAAPGWLRRLGRYRSELEQDRLSRLQDLAAPLRSQLAEVSVELLRGRPAVEITRQVLQHGFDIVIKDACGLPGQETLLIGPVDMRLMRNCPCPVWLQLSDWHAGRGVILAAIDPLAEDPGHRRMNEAILGLGSSLASIERSEFHVTAAWDAAGESMLAGRISEDQLLAYATEAHNAAEKGLQQAVNKIRPHLESSRVDLRRGHPASVILESARETQCDLLIMGTVARGQPGLAMGDTADAVLRQIKCSVLTVKPDGFVSPVRL